VLQYRSKTVANEVESGLQRRISGLQAFKKLFPESKSYVVGAGGIPWEEFLSIDVFHLF
jgi:hypothetical protein